MNTDYFNKQREIAHLRVSQFSRKGYAKASELKSKSQGVFKALSSPKQVTSENIKLTSFTPVTFQSSRQNSSIHSVEKVTPLTSAENQTPYSIKENCGGGLF